MAMILAELLAYLFDGQPNLLSESMSAWLTSSRRFTAFVNTNHTKIHKKIRTAEDPETQGDLHLELETAFLLLRERSFSVVYEPQYRELGRSPDFSVSFTTSFTFMVEVTRLRLAHKISLPNDLEGTDAMKTLNTSPSTSLPTDRFSDMVLSKLGQLLPHFANLLVVGMDSLVLPPSDLSASMLRILQRAEGADPAILQRYGFRDRSDFFRHFQRLSAIIIRAISLQDGETVVPWVNSQAKYLIPTKVNTALFRSHTL